MSQLRPVTLRFSALLAAAVAIGVAVGWAAKEPPAVNPEFTSGVFDLGVVVSDVEKSAEFYTKVVGFTELDPFDVPPDFAGDTGLTDKKPFTVRVFVINGDKSATKLKLIQFKDAPKKVDNGFINSSLGFRYLTIWVSDTNGAMARLNKAGVKPLAKGPVPLPKGFPEGVFLTCVKDPDGNMVELVGPKK